MALDTIDLSEETFERAARQERMKATWPIDKVKENPAPLLEAACSGVPQYIANSPQPDLVLVTREQFDWMKRIVARDNEAFVEFLMSGPEGDIFPEGYAPEDIRPRELEF